MLFPKGSVGSSPINRTMKNFQIIEELVKIKLDIERNHVYYAKDKINALMEKLCKGGEFVKKQIYRSHKDSCMIEMDPEYYGPCTCSKNDHMDYDY